MCYLVVKVLDTTHIIGMSAVADTEFCKLAWLLYTKHEIINRKMWIRSMIFFLKKNE